MVYFSAVKPTQQSNRADVVATLSRREWLYGFVGLCGVLSFNVAHSMANAGFPVTNTENWLLRLVEHLRGDLSALRQQGESYLAAHPDEADREQLLQLLVPSGWATNALPGLVTNVKRDWMSHNVTTVNGWVLARTEARLCALIFLTDRVPA